MRGQGRPVLGRRRGQTLALVVLAALITACVGFVPVYDRAMQEALVDTMLTRATASDVRSWCARTPP